MNSGDRARVRASLVESHAAFLLLPDDLVQGRVDSFAEIAKREGKVERHIRLLAPLAFVSPRIIAAIAQDAAPAGMTVSALAKRLPVAWTAQEAHWQSR